MRSFRNLQKLVSSSWAPYASALTVAGLAACSSVASPGGSEQTTGESSASEPHQEAAPGNTFVAGRRLLSGHVTQEMKKAPVVNRVEPATQVALLFSLPVNDLEGLRAAAASVADPESPSYRKYMTVEAFGEKYGASAAEYQKLVDWAKAKGFEVSPHPNRLALRVTAAAANVEAAPKVRLVHALREDGTEFFMPDAEPSMDVDLPVERISGLDNFHVQKHADATGADSGYSARDLRAAYTSCTVVNVSHQGEGQSVGLYIPGGAFLQSDVNIYAAKSEQATPAVIDTVPWRPAFTGSAEVEPSVDVQMVTALAPAAHIVVFTDTDDTALQAMAARSDIKQFSSSYFPAAHAAGQAALLEMALQGQSFFNASGDSGGLAPNYSPIDIRSQDQVTNVGGTVLVTSAGSYQSESAWSGASGWILTDGTNGVPIPPYQAGLATAANGASATYRNIPDVALIATNATIYRNGNPEVWAGTSFASPLWAAFTALINQVAAESKLPSLGFPNPTLYHLARTSRSQWVFHDITSGSTGPFAATAGYDLATGLGSPKCALIGDLAIPRLTVPPTSDVLLQNNQGDVELWRMRDTSVAASGYVDLGSATSDWVLKGTGDFNGDGQGDLFWRNQTTGVTEAWLLKNGTVSSYSGTGSITSDWLFQGTGDFNNDGTSDILWRNSGTGTVEIWQMKNGGQSAFIGLPAADWSWTIQGIGDFDGDGTSDILWRNSNGAVAIWHVVNGAVAAYWDPGSADATWSIQGVGDFDGDGKSDILWRNTSGGLQFWKMNGGVTTSFVGIGSAASEWSVQGIGDFNEDGVSDILWRSSSSGNVQVWQMSTSTITFHGIGNLSSAWTVRGTLAD